MTPSKPVPVFAADRYLVADDGTHAYPLSGYWANLAQLPDGARLVTTVQPRYGGDPVVTWLLTPGPIPAVTIVQPGRTETTGWRILDPAAASERFPEHVDPETWAARYADTDTEIGFMASRLYQRETRQIPGEHVDHPTAGLTRLDGEVDAHPDRKWIADQPGALVYSENFHHLLPGRMPGLRAAVKAALTEQLGGYTGYNTSRGGVYDWEGRDGRQLEVTLSLPYSPPRHHNVQSYTRSGRKASGRNATRQAESFQTLKVMIPLHPDASVAADSKAAAVDAFEREVDAWLDWVGTHRMAVCSHCNGDGALPVGGQSPSQARAAARAAREAAAKAEAEKAAAAAAVPPQAASQADPWGEPPF